MLLQHIAHDGASRLSIDAGEPQASGTKTGSYLFEVYSRRFPEGCSLVADPRNAKGIRMLSGYLCVDKTYRRLTCLRALRAFALFPCLPSWLHAATTQVKLKNLWSLTQFQLLLNQHTTANCKRSFTILEQAFAPVPHSFQPSRRAA